jgi:methyl-accepting chemotaxis protein-2 (aspartate sensor receptor)
VARKLILVIASGITVVLVAAAFGLSSFLTDTLEKKALDALQANNRMVIDMIDTYNRSLEQTVVRLGGVFAGNYGQAFSSMRTGAASRQRNDLHGEHGHSRPLHGAGPVAATVLTRQGSDFGGTSTSIKDDSGQRAAGVPLGAGHPAGAPAQGRGIHRQGPDAGRDFMTHYQPIKDRDGQVVGAFLSGWISPMAWWR